MAMRSSAPGGYVPEVAVTFGGRTGDAQAVDAATPLPVSNVLAPAAAVPLSGIATASGGFGPFVPDLGRPIWVRLWGSWSGRVTVQRSTDGGQVRAALTAGGAAWGVFTANVQEIVGEESVAGATWWLAFEGTGTLGFEVRQ
jgi:hypothetical protein